MADLAAHLVDRVWPDVPVRQWVLTLSHRVRLLCAYDKVVCSAVRRILVRAVSGFYLQGARRAGLPRAKAGAVVHQQRFDSAVRLSNTLCINSGQECLRRGSDFLAEEWGTNGCRGGCFAAATVGVSAAIGLSIASP